MARRRQIDPEFWQSNTVASLSREQRLFFIGLWSNADDEGWIKGDPTFLKAAVFPYDDLSTSVLVSWTEKLRVLDCIRVYVIGKRRYIEIVNWTRYQYVDHPRESTLKQEVEAHRARRKSAKQTRASRESGEMHSDAAKQQPPRLDKSSYVPTSPGKSSLGGEEESEGERGGGSFKLLASRHSRLLRKFASKSKKNKAKYAESCERWGEEAVLKAFEEWAEQRGEQMKRYSDPLHFFWQDLPDAMEAREDERKEGADEKRDRLGQKPLTLEEKAIYERYAKPASDKVH